MNRVKEAVKEKSRFDVFHVVHCRSWLGSCRSVCEQGDSAELRTGGGVLDHPGGVLLAV